MRPDPKEAFRVVEQFERALCGYTGAPFAITTDSATNALFLCFKRRATASGRERFTISIPSQTYVGVVQAAKNAGWLVELVNVGWTGEYEIHPLRIVDAAKWLRDGMYGRGTLTCLSFQAYKQLPIGRGGAILCDDEDDAEWFRKARFDGRDMETSLYRQQQFGFGSHCYLDPPSAARGLWLMAGLKDNAQPIGSWEDYPSLDSKEWT